MPPTWLRKRPGAAASYWPSETHNKQTAELPCWDPTCTTISCSSCHQLLITSKQNRFRADNEILLTVIAFPVLRYLIFDSKASIQGKKKKRTIHNSFKKQIALFGWFFFYLLSMTLQSWRQNSKFLSNGVRINFFSSSRLWQNREKTSHLAYVRQWAQHQFLLRVRRL